MKANRVGTNLPAFAYTKAIDHVFERQVLNNQLHQLGWKNGERVDGGGR